MLLKVEHDGTWRSERIPLRLTRDEDGALIATDLDGQRYLGFAELGRLAEAQAQRADAATERAERLAARLRELGIDPDTV